MPASRQWLFRPDQEGDARALADRLGLDDVVGALLVNREIGTEDAAQRYLRPSLEHLHDPFLLAGMDQAVARVEQALRENERIVIYGDYDVDGSVATALLMLFFGLIGANATYHIPRRRAEGYGLNKDVLDQLAEDGAKLLITVDTGINAIEEIAHANSLGIDAIVTDHHVASDELPAAHAIVNPKQPACNYPHTFLCGAGVAFKLAWAIAEGFSPGRRESREFEQFLETAMALVAIATIADLVPLRDENRVFVSFGLTVLPNTSNPGLRALLEVCNIANTPIDASHIAFRMGPRLNAGGRMGKEDLGVRLLLSQSYQEALGHAEMMDGENRARQEIERAITEDARRRVREEIDLSHTSVIVMADDTWHAGVIGIVASRLTDEFWRPTVLIALDGDRGRGSARSIPGFNIYEVLATCEDLMSSFGGHAFAAGLEISRENVEALRLRVNAVAGDYLTPTTLKPSLTLDGELSPSRLTLGLLRELERLAPFGEGNAQPMFATPPIRLVGRPRIVGRLDQHLTFYVADGTGRGIKAIAYNMADWYTPLIENGHAPGGNGNANGNGNADEHELRLAFIPRINRYRGDESPELLVRDIHLT